MLSGCECSRKKTQGLVQFDPLRASFQFDGHAESVLVRFAGEHDPVRGCIPDYQGCIWNRLWRILFRYQGAYLDLDPGYPGQAVEPWAGGFNAFGVCRTGLLGIVSTCASILGDAQDD